MRPIAEGLFVPALVLLLIVGGCDSPVAPSQGFDVHRGHLAAIDDNAQRHDFYAFVVRKPNHKPWLIVGRQPHDAEGVSEYSATESGVSIGGRKFTPDPDICQIVYVKGDVEHRRALTVSDPSFLGLATNRENDDLHGIADLLLEMHVESGITPAP